MAKRRAKKKAAPKPARKRKPAPKVTAVRKDSRGRAYDVKTGAPVPAEKARRFKTFFDTQGRRRKTKGGEFAGGKSIAPTKKAKKRKGLVSAFKPGKARERGPAQEALVKKRRKKRATPVVTKMRYVGGAATQRLAKLFGINLANPVRGDFASLIEAQGRELGRGSFFVADPIGDKQDGRKSIWQGVERATRFVREIAPPQTVALTVNIVVQGGDVGSQSLIVPSNDPVQAKGGVMAAIFSSLGEAGLDASDGSDDNLEPVEDLAVEVIAYELE